MRRFALRSSVGAVSWECAPARQIDEANPPVSEVTDERRVEEFAERALQSSARDDASIRRNSTALRRLVPVANETRIGRRAGSPFAPRVDVVHGEGFAEEHDADDAHGHVPCASLVLREVVPAPRMTGLCAHECRDGDDLVLEVGAIREPLRGGGLDSVRTRRELDGLERASRARDGSAFRQAKQSTSTRPWADPVFLVPRRRWPRRGRARSELGLLGLERNGRCRDGRRRYRGPLRRGTTCSEAERDHRESPYSELDHGLPPCGGRSKRIAPGCTAQNKGSPSVG